MKIEQMGAQASAPQTQNQAPSARDRAMAKLLGTPSQAQQAPVSNPSSVSPEEMSAIAPAAEEEDEFEKAKNQAQKHPDESSESETKAETKVSEEPLSSQYAILARKEKAIRLRDQQLKAREAAIKASEEAAKAPKAPSFDETKYVSKEKLSQDPFSVLTEMGLTYDQLTEFALNGPKPKEIELMNEIKSMRDELKALKGDTESTRKTFQEYQEQNEKHGINELTKRATTLIDTNPEFETIKETGSIGDVVELIKQTLKEDGVLLTVEEAAQQVEDYLVEEALKLARIKKIQQKLAPKAPAEGQKLTDQSKKSELKTLTNSVGTSRQLSARERALLAFEGKLNK